MIFDFRSDYKPGTENTEHESRTRIQPPPPPFGRVLLLVQGGEFCAGIKPRIRNPEQDKRQKYNYLMTPVKSILLGKQQSE